MDAQIKRFQEFIDLLVELTPSIGARRVSEGVWNRNYLPGEPGYERLLVRLPAEAAHIVTDQVAYNQLLTELTGEQRDVLAKLLQDERRTAIFDVLVTLEGYRLSKDGVELASEPYGYTSFQEYLSRLNGGPWPEE